MIGAFLTLGLKWVGLHPRQEPSICHKQTKIMSLEMSYDYH